MNPVAVVDSPTVDVQQQPGVAVDSRFAMRGSKQTREVMRIHRMWSPKADQNVPGNSFGGLRAGVSWEHAWPALRVESR